MPLRKARSEPELQRLLLRHGRKAAPYLVCCQRTMCGLHVPAPVRQELAKRRSATVPPRERNGPAGIRVLRSMRHRKPRSTKDNTASRRLPWMQIEQRNKPAQWEGNSLRPSAVPRGLSNGSGQPRVWKQGASNPCLLWKRPSRKADRVSLGVLCSMAQRRQSVPIRQGQ